MDSRFGVNVETNDVTHEHREWDRIWALGDLGTDIDLGLWGV